MKHLNIGRFVTYKGMVFTVPSALCSISPEHAASCHDEEISNIVERQKDKNNYDVEDENAAGFVLAGPSSVSGNIFSFGLNLEVSKKDDMSEIDLELQSTFRTDNATHFGIV